jgi:hypothetical protein
MELFRVGGDVPDTNYLFMGMLVLHSSRFRVLTLLKVILSTEGFTP